MSSGTGMVVMGLASVIIGAVCLANEILEADDGRPAGIDRVQGVSCAGHAIGTSDQLSQIAHERDLCGGAGGGALRGREEDPCVIWCGWRESKRYFRPVRRMKTGCFPISPWKYLKENLSPSSAETDREKPRFSIWSAGENFRMPEKVLLDGEDVTRLPDYRRARRIGRVFQDPAKGTCATLTILENLSLAANKGKFFGLGGGVNRKRMEEFRALLRTLNLGLEDRLDQPVGSLSGGQRQALALLISTMTPIDLLVLDEHTAALDPRSSETIMEITRRVVEEKHLTTLMVTHNLKYAAVYGNRLIMMHQGKIAMDLRGEEKRAISMEALLSEFNRISLETGL